MPAPVVIALGSNVGNRGHNIESGIAALQSSAASGPVISSRIYQGPAHTLEGTDRQHDYFNAVSMFDTSLSPTDLLNFCLSTETAHGRQRTRGVRWQPRTLDLDIILYGEQTISVPNLSIPHPELAKRRFVLEPLAEIAPLLYIPAPFDACVQYLLERCEDSSILEVVPVDQQQK